MFEKKTKNYGAQQANITDKNLQRNKMKNVSLNTVRNILLRKHVKVFLLTFLNLQDWPLSLVLLYINVKLQKCIILCYDNEVSSKHKQSKTE